MDDFLARALFAGLGIAVTMGPLGTFIVWRRMAYFGDTLAHSALLGVALGLLIGIDPTIGIVAVCIVLALALVALRRRQRLADDTLLGILSHGSLSFGLIAIAALPDVRVDLMSYLFGDILAVRLDELYWIVGGGIIVLGILAWLWRPLLLIAVHEEMARVEGVAVERTQILFMLLVAGVIALAMKLVGILLVTALLIIPAAAARNLAKTPEQMAALAALAGALAVVGGLAGSVAWDLPTGPAVVAAATVLFALVVAITRRWTD